MAVYEAAAELKEIGVGVALHPNAMKVLRAIGVEGNVRKVAGRSQWQVMRNWKTGRVLTARGPDDAADRKRARNSLRRSSSRSPSSDADNGVSTKPAGIAAGEDDIGTLSPGVPGGFEADARAAADHDDGLPGLVPVRAGWKQKWRWS